MPFYTPNAAGTLIGTTLASNVVASSLTSVGTLTSLVMGGNITSSGYVQATIFYANDGTAAAPSLTQNSDPDNGIYFGSNTVGIAAAGVAAATITSLIASFKGAVRPGTDAAAIQTACGLYAGSGAPSDVNGQNGDIYFRSDGGALTTTYQRRAGVWVGLL